MQVLMTLKKHPALFFAYRALRVSGFMELISKIQPTWVADERRRLSRSDRQRGIRGGTP